MNSKNIEAIGVQFFIDHFEKPEIMRDLCTSEFVVHFSFGPELRLEETISMLAKANTKPRVEILDSFAAKERVALRFRATIPQESGGTVVRNENVIMRFEGKKISECWVAFDRQHEQEQIDALAQGGSR